MARITKGPHLRCSVILDETIHSNLILDFLISRERELFYI